MFDKFKDLMAMKKQAEEMQAQLALEHFTGTSRDGQISMTINGNQDIITVSVPEDGQLAKIAVERGIKEAHADARSKSESVLRNKMMGMLS